MDKLDAENFDSKKTFESLLKSQNLKHLVQTNLEIQAEIKSLDHDVQSLVFENYSKFISSIEVVKNMREELEKTEKDLDRLSFSIGNIKTISTQIDDTLKPKRDEIQRLDKINKDLSNLKMLCELPVMLKDDLKQLHSMDFRNMTRDELEKHKGDLLKICTNSVQNLNNCKDKLLEFHNEPLIAPIFIDVTKYLKEIQNYLFLHFHDNYSKLSFDMLTDLFYKLFNITVLIDICSKINKNLKSSIAIDNIITNFFKNISSTFLFKIEQINSDYAADNIDEVSTLSSSNIENQKGYDNFKSRFISICEKNSNLKAFAELNELTSSILKNIKTLDDQVNNSSATDEILTLYEKKKFDFISSFMNELYNSVTCINFYFKIKLITQNKDLLPRRLGDKKQHPLELLLNRYIFKDIIEFLDLIRILMDINLKNKELIDKKNTKFPLIRNETTIKHELMDLAENFISILSNYARFIKETLEAYLVNTNSVDLNLDTLLYRFLMKLVSSYNNQTYFYQSNTAVDVSFENNMNDGEVSKNQHNLKLLSYVLMSKLYGIFESGCSKKQQVELKKILIANIMCYMEKSWINLFLASVNNSKDIKPQTEAINSVKNLIFAVNNIEKTGNPKTRISKGKLTNINEKVTETSKLLARQNFIFEDPLGINRQKLYFGFAKLFFKTFKVFFKSFYRRSFDLSPLFSVLVQSSQIFFECVEKSDEKNVLAFFYQTLDDFADYGFVVDNDRLDFLLQSSTEQMF